MPFSVIWSPDFGATKFNFATYRKAEVIAKKYETTPPHIVVGEKDLALVHSLPYIDAVATGRPRPLAESQGFRWDPLMYTSAAAHCAGVVSAVEKAIREGGNHVTLSSGLHHARRGRGSCFCTFNGIALATAMLPVARILILDFDAHGGGGTESLLLHKERQFDVSTINLDLPEQQSVLVEDKTKYLEHIVTTLLAAAAHPWDCVLYNAGVDFVDNDADVERLISREKLVFSWAENLGLPVAVTLAGGYGDLNDVADLHSITINTAKEFSNGR